MHWSFAKYVGCGNDFVLFDNRHETFPLHPKLIQRLCHRQWGIGADGLLLIENSTQAHFRMRIFNSDGSEAEMCGNGLRCFIKHLRINILDLHSYQIETKSSCLKAEIIGSEICLQMNRPSRLEWNIPLVYDQQTFSVHFLNTGVPHTVRFVKDVNAIDLPSFGSYIRSLPRWADEGTNVNIAQQVDRQVFKVRTYERGVGETLACGTGAVAVGLAAAYQYHSESPITMQTLSGEDLTVGFCYDNGTFSNITLMGSAKFTFRGEIDLPEKEEIPSFSIASNSFDSVKS